MARTQAQAHAHARTSAAIASQVSVSVRAPSGAHDIMPPCAACERDIEWWFLRTQLIRWSPCQYCETDGPDEEEAEARSDSQETHLLLTAARSLDDVAATHLSLDHIPETTTPENKDASSLQGEQTEAPIELTEEELDAMIE